MSPRRSMHVGIAGACLGEPIRERAYRTIPRSSKTQGRLCNPAIVGEPVLASAVYRVRVVRQIFFWSGHILLTTSRLTVLNVLNGSSRLFVCVATKKCILNP